MSSSCPGTCSTFDQPGCKIPGYEYVVPSAAPSVTADDDDGRPPTSGGGGEPKGFLVSDTSLYGSGYFWRSLFVAAIVIVLGFVAFFYCKSKQKGDTISTGNKGEQDKFDERFESAPVPPSSHDISQSFQNNSNNSNNNHHNNNEDDHDNDDMRMPSMPYDDDDDDVIVEPDVLPKDDKKKKKNAFSWGSSKKKKEGELQPILVDAQVVSSSSSNHHGGNNNMMMDGEDGFRDERDDGGNGAVYSMPSGYGQLDDGMVLS